MSTRVRSVLPMSQETKHIQQERSKVKVTGGRAKFKMYNGGVCAVSYTHLDVYKRQVSNSGSNMIKISEEIINKVSNNDNSKNELISNSDKIVENELFKGDIMKIDSDEVEKCGNNASMWRGIGITFDW